MLEPRSLRFRMLLGSLLVELVVMAVIVFNGYRLMNEAVLRTVDTTQDEMAITLTAAVAPAARKGDLTVLQGFFDELTSLDHHGVRYVRVVGSDGRVLLGAGALPGARLPEPDTDLSAAIKRRIVNIRRPLLLAGGEPGLLQFGMSSEALLRARRELLFQGAALTAISVLITALLLGIVANWVYRRLDRVIQSSVALARGDYAQVIPVSGEDEIATLAHNFNLMSAAVRERMKALAASETEFRSLFEQSAVGLALVDTGGRLLRFNRRLCQIMKVGPVELDRLRLEPLPFLAGIARRAHDRIREGHTDPQESDHVYRTGGEVVWLRLTVSAFDSGSGERSLLLVFQDITKQKHAEIALIENRNQLEDLVDQRTAALAEAQQELESFSYSVSHDLRSPLRAITGFSHLLREQWGGEIPASADDYLGRVIAAGKRMDEQIDALLHLSRLFRQEPRLTEVDLSALAGEVAAELQASWKGLAIEFDIRPGLRARADPQLMRMALENLLGNAVKYSSRQALVKVSFGREPTARGEAFCIADNGVGFDMAYASKLFGVFQRLHGRSEFEGFGVGLAGVKRIVARHGGDIWAESNPGQGARFFFTLQTRPQPPGAPAETEPEAIMPVQAELPLGNPDDA